MDEASPVLEQLAEVTAAGVLKDSETIQSTGISASATTATFAAPQPVFCWVVVEVAAMAGYLLSMSVPGAAAPKPLMNTAAMITTQRKIRMEIAAPIPRFSALNRLSQARIDTDPVPLLPWVRMKMLSKIRNESSVRNSSATRIAGFISGTVIRQNRCQPVAPSTLAAFCRSSGTRESPASSSRPMNGVVFQISARMITAIALYVEVSGAPWLNTTDR